MTPDQIADLLNVLAVIAIDLSVITFLLILAMVLGWGKR